LQNDKKQSLGKCNTPIRNKKINFIKKNMNLPKS